MELDAAGELQAGVRFIAGARGVPDAKARAHVQLEGPLADLKQQRWIHKSLRRTWRPGLRAS